MQWTYSGVCLSFFRLYVKTYTQKKSILRGQVCTQGICCKLKIKPFF